MDASVSIGGQSSFSAEARIIHRAEASITATSNVEAQADLGRGGKYLWPHGVPRGMFFVLDCPLGTAKVKWLRRSMSHLANAREVMIELREAENLTPEELDESGVVRLRTISVGGYLETMEKDE